MMRPSLIQDSGGSDGEDTAARSRILALEGKVDPTISQVSTCYSLGFAASYYGNGDTMPFDLDLTLAAQGYSALELTVLIDDAHIFEVNCDVPLIEALWELQADFYGAPFFPEIFIELGLSGRNIYAVARKMSPGTDGVTFWGTAANAFGIDTDIVFSTYEDTRGVNAREVIIYPYGATDPVPPGGEILDGQTLESEIHRINMQMYGIGDQLKSTMRSSVVEYPVSIADYHGTVVLDPQLSLADQLHPDAFVAPLIIEVELADGSVESTELLLNPIESPADLVARINLDVSISIGPARLWCYLIGDEDTYGYLNLTLSGAAPNEFISLTFSGAAAYLGIETTLIADTRPYRAVKLDHAIVKTSAASNPVRATDVIARLESLCDSQSAHIRDLYARLSQSAQRFAALEARMHDMDGM